MSNPTGRHRDLGQHFYKDEALVRATIAWENSPGIIRPHRTRADRRRSQDRTVVWATDRPVPLGVTGGAA